MNTSAVSQQETIGRETPEKQSFSEMMELIDAALASDRLDDVQASLSIIENQMNGSPETLNKAQEANMKLIRHKVKMLARGMEAPEEEAEALEFLKQDLMEIRAIVSELLEPAKIDEKEEENANNEESPEPTPETSLTHSTEGLMKLVLLHGVRYNPDDRPPDPASLAIAEHTKDMTAQELTALKEFLQNPAKSTLLTKEVKATIASITHGESLSDKQILQRLKDEKNKAEDAVALIKSQTRIKDVKEAREATERVRLLARAIEAKQGRRTYKSTEEALAMMHYYEEGGDEDANYQNALENTMRDVEKYRERNYGLRHRFFSEITGGIFKTTLKTTLKGLAERKDLKGVDETGLMSLAKRWNKPKAVADWVEGLSSPNQTVPQLIGYIETALRAGHMCYLNTTSLTQAKTLVRHLRLAMSERFIEEGEGAKGDDLDKMTDYFGKLNAFSKKQEKINSAALLSASRWGMAKNVAKFGAIPAGVAYGGAAAAGMAGVNVAQALGTVTNLSLSQLAGGAGVLAAGGARIKSRDIQNKTLRKLSQRTLTAGAMAAGGLAAGLAATPLALIGGGALIGPSLYKHRQKLKRAAFATGRGIEKGGRGLLGVGKATLWTGKMGLKTAGFGLKTAWYGSKLGLGVLSGGTLLLSSKYRRSLAHF